MHAEQCLTKSLLSDPPFFCFIFFDALAATASACFPSLLLCVDTSKPACIRIHLLTNLLKMSMPGCFQPFMVPTMPLSGTFPESSIPRMRITIRHRPIQTICVVGMQPHLLFSLATLLHMQNIQLALNIIGAGRIVATLLPIHRAPAQIADFPQQKIDIAFQRRDLIALHRRSEISPLRLVSWIFLQTRDLLFAVPALPQIVGGVRGYRLGRRLAIVLHEDVAQHKQHHQCQHDVARVAFGQRVGRG
mmetsp:Transcript_14022/g.38525  ORF Transcript_14022/g.38525 Transcript_14022/m.38525 type:complete len:247 (+) Transcript_14022:47-787(+)